MHVNGRQLAVESAGAGPAVVFLHGIGGTSNVYQVQADALAPAYRVIRPDFAGAGRSPAEGEISIEAHAADIAAVLDAAGAGPAVIVGHSMGTLVARVLAARHPAKVAGLALLGPVQPPDAVGGEAILARAALIRAQGPAAIADAIVARSLSAATRSAKPEIAAFVRELVMRQDQEGYARNNEALAAAVDPGPVDPRLPLLLIAGREDTLSPPAVSEGIARAHGRADVRVIEGIGHQIPLEDARAVTAILTAFVATCSAQATTA
ncbi:MAG TPA: alpha/beta hydrolase [Trebonia sp.]|nr:alpha/beta hydrolase [Trebonia sp.]